MWFHSCFFHFIYLSFFIHIFYLLFRDCVCVYMCICTTTTTTGFFCLFIYLFFPVSVLFDNLWSKNFITYTNETNKKIKREREKKNYAEILRREKRTKFKWKKNSSMYTDVFHFVFVFVFVSSLLFVFFFKSFFFFSFFLNVV